MMRLKKKKGFTLVEALIAIWAMVIAAAAILSAFVSSSQLRVFSENFTRGINACQDELEEIRFRYERQIITFAQLISLDGTSFSVRNADGTVDNDFGGMIVTDDPWPGGSVQAETFVDITARVAFRQGQRIIGGNDALVPNNNTPCQITMTLTNMRSGD